jgi:hypothetical protein
LGNNDQVGAACSAGSNAGDVFMTYATVSAILLNALN